MVKYTKMFHSASCNSSRSLDGADTKPKPESIQSPQFGRIRKAGGHAAAARPAPAAHERGTAAASGVLGAPGPAPEEATDLDCPRLRAPGVPVRARTARDPKALDLKTRSP